MSRHEQAIEWAREAVPRHLAETKLLGLAVYCGEPNVIPYFDCPVDLPPLVGRVMEVTEDWILTRSGSGWFFVCARDLADKIPVVGSMVRITTYARRNFEGKRLDGINESDRSIELLRAASWGHWRSSVPLAGRVVRSSSLLALLEYIEVLRAPDRLRRLSHVLIDAGATQEASSIVDASRGFDRPRPSITFRVRTQKVDGWLRIECSSLSGDFRPCLLSPEGELLHTEGPISADVLTALIVDWIDDGQWRIAKVEALATPDAN